MVPRVVENVVVQIYLQNKTVPSFEHIPLSIKYSFTSKFKCAYFGNL